MDGTRNSLRAQQMGRHMDPTGLRIISAISWQELGAQPDDPDGYKISGIENSKAEPRYTARYHASIVSGIKMIYKGNYWERP